PTRSTLLPYTTLFRSGDGGEAEDHERQDEDREHRQLHLAALDLLAEVLGRATHHQAGDEDGEQREDQHAVEAAADAAEDEAGDRSEEHTSELQSRGHL